MDLWISLRWRELTSSEKGWGSDGYPGTRARHGCRGSVVGSRLVPGYAVACGGVAGGLFGWVGGSGGIVHFGLVECLVCSFVPEFGLANDHVVVEFVRGLRSGEADVPGGRKEAHRRWGGRVCDVLPRTGELLVDKATSRVAWAAGDEHVRVL